MPACTEQLLPGVPRHLESSHHPGRVGWDQYLTIGFTNRETPAQGRCSGAGPQPARLRPCWVGCVWRGRAVLCLPQPCRAGELGLADSDLGCLHPSAPQAPPFLSITPAPRQYSLWAEGPGHSSPGAEILEALEQLEERGSPKTLPCIPHCRPTEARHASAQCWRHLVVRCGPCGLPSPSQTWRCQVSGPGGRCSLLRGLPGTQGDGPPRRGLSLSWSSLPPTPPVQEKGKRQVVPERPKSMVGVGGQWPPSPPSHAQPSGPHRDYAVSAGQLPTGRPPWNSPRAAVFPRLHPPPCIGGSGPRAQRSGRKAGLDGTWKAGREAGVNGHLCQLPLKWCPL